MWVDTLIGDSTFRVSQHTTPDNWTNLNATNSILDSYALTEVTFIENDYIICEFLQYTDGGSDPYMEYLFRLESEVNGSSYTKMYFMQKITTVDVDLGSIQLGDFKCKNIANKFITNYYLRDPNDPALFIFQRVDSFNLVSDTAFETIVNDLAEDTYTSSLLKFEFVDFQSLDTAASNVKAELYFDLTELNDFFKISLADPTPTFVYGNIIELTISANSFISGNIISCEVYFIFSLLKSTRRN